MLCKRSKQIYALSWWLMKETQQNVQVLCHETLRRMSKGCNGDVSASEMLKEFLSFRFDMSVKDLNDFRVFDDAMSVSQGSFIRFFRHILPMKFTYYHDHKLAWWKIAAIIIMCIVIFCSLHIYFSTPHHLQYVIKKNLLKIHSRYIIHKVNLIGAYLEFAIE